MISPLVYTILRVCRSQAFKAFTITYLAYTTLYATRKPFSVVKTQIQDHLHITTTWLGIIDTAFLAAYAVGQIVLPAYLLRGGKRDISTILLVLYVGSGVVTMAFGVASDPEVMATFWLLNGLMHAAVFPILITSISPWFASSERGKIMGSWTTSQQVGAIVSTLASAWIAHRYGWRLVFLVPGVITILVGIALKYALRGTGATASYDSRFNSPVKSSPAPAGPYQIEVTIGRKREEQISHIDVLETTRTSVAGDEMELTELRADARVPKTDSTFAESAFVDAASPELAGAGGSVGRRTNMTWEMFYSVLRIKDVKYVGASYFCVKWIRYSLLFWLPYYLATELKYTQEAAGYASIVFDVGGIFGGLLTGLFADKMLCGKRIVVALGSCLASASALLIFATYAHLSTLIALILMSGMGIFVAGVDSLLGASAATDLCERGNCAHNTSLLSSVSGYINGCGSLGAVFQGYMTAKVSSLYGWNMLFCFLASIALCGSLCLIIPSINEVRAH